MSENKCKSKRLVNDGWSMTGEAIDYSSHVAPVASDDAPLDN